MRHSNKGFTLMELMIVVAIIGLLAASAFPVYQDYMLKAKLSKIKSTLAPIEFALATYFQEYGSFPNGSIDTRTAAVPGNLWSSIGLADGTTPALPPEVSLLAVDGTAGATVSMTLTIAPGRVRAVTVDGLNLAILGEVGGTASTWITQCSAASGTTITDPIALSYFGC